MQENENYQKWAEGFNAQGEQLEGFQETAAHPTEHILSEHEKNEEAAKRFDAWMEKVFGGAVIGVGAVAAGLSIKSGHDAMGYLNEFITDPNFVKLIGTVITGKVSLASGAVARMSVNLGSHMLKDK